MSKRTRRTKAQIEQLEAQIIEALRRHNPASVRHVFYLMTNPRLPEQVAKTERGYTQVQNRLTRMRRDGKIPYHWISDSTRRGWHVPTFSNPGELIRRYAGLYRVDLWRDVPEHVEVWAESRSIAGILESVCNELAVSLYPTGGFSSLTLTYEAAAEIDRQGKERAVILYVGDYDAAGVTIDAKVQEELERHCVTPIEFQRLAINPEQIRQYDLPTKPRKATERRRVDILETVEAEAMPPDILRAIVRETVEAYLPPQAVDVAKVAEQEEIAGLQLLGAGVEDYGLRDFIGQA